MGRIAWSALLFPLLVACLSIDETAEKGSGGPKDASVEGGVFPEAEAGGSGGTAGVPDGGLCEPGVDCSACPTCVTSCVCEGGEFLPCKSQCGLGGGGSGGLPP